MDREESVALREALGAVLAWPESVRAAIARWLAPEPGKSNGHDPHPAAVMMPKAPEPETARARGKAATPTEASERRLVAAMRLDPKAGVNALAKATGAARSTTGERLRRLATQGMVKKTPDGRWRLAGEDPSETASSRPAKHEETCDIMRSEGQAPDPTSPSPN
jgi:hypothetical protein